MATLHLEIVTPEKLAYSSDVESVVIPAVEGEMGVLPQHIPLMTQIHAGELVISKGGHVYPPVKNDVIMVGYMVRQNSLKNKKSCIPQQDFSLIAQKKFVRTDGGMIF